MAFSARHADSDRWGDLRFGLGVAVRAVIIGVMAFAAVAAVAAGYYATAAVLAVLILALLADLVRSIGAADRLMAQFIDGLTTEGHDRPAPRRGFRQMTLAIDTALGRLGVARAERQRRIDHLEALTDNVAAALLVIDVTGEILSANRAARQGLGAVAGPLASVPALSAETAERLMDLAPGARVILRLQDGRAVLAQVALFTAEARAYRLVSLQSLAGELDAVELKAWQDLVRVLAHEMMNSLTPVCSISESLAARLRAGGADPAEVAEAIEVIARRSTGLMSFVERYRRLTDLPNAEKIRLPAADLIKGLDRLLGPLMADGGVDYASKVEPASLILDADPDLLEQALINLLKNALEAVRGRPDAAVRLACRVDEDQAVLIVEDNGPGLPEGDPEAAFVPFFTTKQGGSGVGLTLARQIALAHGGRLDHARRSAGGVVFRLWLPLG
ncbi:ATP-binding protein [uncultured Phenylobacterium sp.]|uniref:sensor histidine kinase n=1 Tax=uncultured Phenylobacterium sp. TaxID=349273 RepID=UPI0025FAE543|nr:ATP-binding protein [uncultured Phenylobacterium sp.]